MIESKPSIFRYWGKAKPPTLEGSQYHPLPYHCLDVAAVGRNYIRRAPALRAFLMRRLRLESEVALENWLAFWLSLHDLGKFAEAFQSQKADLFRDLRGRSPAKSYGTLRHDSLGMLIWCDALSRVAEEGEWFGPLSGPAMSGLDCWMRAVTGHHGQPPETAASEDWRRHFDSTEDYPAVLAFVAEMRGLFLNDSVAMLQPSLGASDFLETSEETSWWIAGLAVLSDWLGSNTDFFPYCADSDDALSLSRYWGHANEKAVEALNASGVLPSPGGVPLRFGDFFPNISLLSPLQEWVTGIEIPDSSQIYLLEDVTGAGKTEAAILLAHRLIAAGRAEGFFIGLPTMATANAMYGRVGEVHDKLFEGFASFVLAQSRRHLVDEFVESIIQAGPEDGDPQQADETATARCTAWLADNNKRSLLAPAAVGTIDQALLAVLHSKHQSLRLLGLFNKVLIVDEVHACDPYMKGVLEALLEFHASAGGSAILLSATMPTNMKQSLLRAFGRGCRTAAPKIRSQSYPLVTRWSHAASKPLLEEELPTRSQVKRETLVRYLSDEDEVVAGIEQALAAGKCVCWMRNTIADALAAHARFVERLSAEKLVLFHARFAIGDRLNVERTVLELFGKYSGSHQRQGRLVIATQVAEQSLDADWDLVVSDLAPIDRLIQRAGRLMRHRRNSNGARLTDREGPDERGEPCLWVLGPVWSDDPSSDWFKAAFPKAATVYPHHGQLWLTARFMRRGRIRMPEDARELIEGVFGDNTILPPSLEANATTAEGRGHAHASIAQQNTIKLVSGYSRDVIDWWSEAKTPSRLGEPTMDVVLARWEGEQLRPWIEGRNGWAYSTVRVPERLIARRHEDAQPAREKVVIETLLSLPNKGKWCVLLPLRQTAGGWIGEAWTAEGKKESPVLKRWKYDRSSGLAEADTSDGLPDE